ncbi:MAG: hypothetical protein RBS05_12535 [Zoogloea oleivorans]|jgi:hypothetical protein|uniref:hypothetical protein n=1 Tax=Zoogloea oleivorans TaxID=1552750 RepID=UPI002A3595ED|nr:hypothetical protein [Zoogloea oleivorans]MDY0036728.1 hypothetical protein [Zoogloea oleivorans]
MWMKPKNGGYSAHVALLSGHAICIPPEGRFVPDMFLQAAAKVAIPMTDGEIEGTAQSDPKPEEQKPEEAGQQEALADAADESGIDKIARLKSAIRSALDAGDTSFMTAAGIPDARKLDRLLGESVSAAERNQAWSEMQAETGAVA